MSQTTNRLFRRNQRNSKQDLINRVATLERELNELTQYFMKTMTICEGLSQIVVEKEVVTKEEYQENIKKAMEKFFVTNNQNIRPATPKTPEELAKLEAEQKEAEENGDPKAESEEPVEDLAEELTKSSTDPENSTVKEVTTAE